MLFSFLVFITVIASSIIKLEPICEEHIKVRVLGEVQCEKEIVVPLHATIGDIVACIELTPSACIEKMALDVCPKQNETIVIPKQGFVSVFVQGDASKLVLLAEGATFRDLRESLQTDSWKRKKRKLKDGETIQL